MLAQYSIANCQIIAETEKVAKQKISLIKSISTSIGFWRQKNLHQSGGFSLREKYFEAEDFTLAASSNVLIWAFFSYNYVWSWPKERVLSSSIPLESDDHCSILSSTEWSYYYQTNMMIFLTRHDMTQPNMTSGIYANWSLLALHQITYISNGWRAVISSLTKTNLIFG